MATQKVILNQHAPAPALANGRKMIPEFSGKGENTVRVFLNNVDIYVQGKLP